MRIRSTGLPVYAPEWAQDGANQTAPTENEIALGWQAGDRIPAKKINWQFDFALKWVKTMLPSVLGGYALPESGVSDDLAGVAWSSAQQAFFAMNGDAGTPAKPLRSYDGVTWDPVGVTNIPYANKGTPIGDIGGKIIWASDSLSNGFLAYSTDLDAASAPYFILKDTGLTEKILRVRTKDDDTFVMASCQGSPFPYTLATAPDVSGTWTLTGLGLGRFEDFVNIEGTQTWVAISTGGEVYKSLDDGASWSQTASLIGTSQYGRIDYNKATGLLIIAGRVTSTNYIYTIVSKDLGDTWGLGQVKAFPMPSSYIAYDLRCLGGTVWMIHMTVEVNFIKGPALLISIDDGVSWQPGANCGETPFAGGFLGAAFNGRTWAAAGEAGQTGYGCISL